MGDKVLTPAEVAEILARCEKAKPGPWDNGGCAQISLTFDDECNIFPPDTMETHGFQFCGPVAVVNYRGESDSNPDGADAEFIAHSRTDVPSLCATITRLRGLIEGIDHEDRCASRVYRLDVHLFPGEWKPKETRVNLGLACNCIKGKI